AIFEADLNAGTCIHGYRIVNRCTNVYHAISFVSGLITNSTGGGNMARKVHHATLIRFVPLLILGLLFTGAQLVSAQEVSDPTIGSQGGRFGIGFASSWPAYGISGTMHFNERITGEAVLGFLGTISNLGGRAWYRF